MDRALWLLLSLRLHGWLRRLKRALSTVKGVLVTVFGGLIVAVWLLSLVVFAPAPTPQHIEGVRQLGPVVLLLFCLLNYFLAAGERVLAFSPAEVNLLFPAPFTRRQLLLYKIAAITFGALLLGLFMGLVLRQHATGVVTSLIGTTLALLFLQYFALTVALVVSIIGARAYSRQRQIILVVLIVAVAALIWGQGAGRFNRRFDEIVDDLRAHPVVEVVLAPFAWQINVLTAEHIWPDLVVGVALSLLSNLVLLAIIIGLDAHYLETAAAASEKIYRRLERIRRGGVAAGGMAVAEKARWSLPNLPRWGGIGPLAWRQLMGALRSYAWMVTVAIFLTAMLAPMIVLASQDKNGEPKAILAVFSIMTFFVALFLPSLLTFDFRADVDRIEVLKSLPLPGWKIVVGQMLIPVVMVTLIQVVMLIALQFVLHEIHPEVLAALPFLVTVNFLIFAAENLFFLWFPTRQLAATPGDIQNFGRILVLWMAKLILLMALSFVAFLLGMVAYFLTGESYIAAGIVAFLFLAGCTAGSVPLLCLAFARFDVSSDIPP